MPTIHFLANVQDPNDPQIVYGKGHYMVSTDEAWIAQLNNEGKIEVLEPAPEIEPPA